jgi:hypothetical protein
MFGVDRTKYQSSNAQILDNDSKFESFSTFAAESYADENDYSIGLKKIMKNYAAKGIDILNPDSFSKHIKFESARKIAYKDELLACFESILADDTGAYDDHQKYNFETIEKAIDLRLEAQDFSAGNDAQQQTYAAEQMFATEGVTYAANWIPVPSVDLPVIPARTVGAVGKDIIVYEVVKKPVFMKHLYQRYYMDTVTGETWQADKLLYGDLKDENGDTITAESVRNKGRGLPISERPVALPLKTTNGADFNIITTLTSGIPGTDRLSWKSAKIVAVIFGEVGDPDADGTYENLEINNTTVFKYNLPAPLTFNPNTYQINDMNSEIKGFRAPNGTVYKDELAGKLDFQNGDIRLTSYTGEIKAVVFSGYLSNEMNNHALSISEKMFMRQFAIDSDIRFSHNITREELDDFKVWQNEDLATRMVGKIAQGQDEFEDQSVIDFYNEDWESIKNIQTADIYAYEGYSRTCYIGIKAPAYVTDPIKFQKDIFGVYASQHLLEMASYNKQQGMTFVFMINPEATRFINGYVDWTNTPGDKMTGIQFNSKYGKGVGLGSATVRVVESNRFPFLQDYTDPETGNVYKLPCIDVKAFPTSPEYMTYKHWQYTSYVAFAPQDSMYTAPAGGVSNPGGMYRSITSARRYDNDKLQPIASKIFIDPTFSSDVNPANVVGKGTPVVANP